MCPVGFGEPTWLEEHMTSSVPFTGFLQSGHSFKDCYQGYGHKKIGPNAEIGPTSSRVLWDAWTMRCSKTFRSVKSWKIWRFAKPTPCCLLDDSSATGKGWDVWRKQQSNMHPTNSLTRQRKLQKWWAWNQIHAPKDGKVNASLKPAASLTPAHYATAGAHLLCHPTGLLAPSDKCAWICAC